jgi:hypothetical protein
MAVKQKVLLVGGTGETGKEILKGLLDDGNIVRIISNVLFTHLHNLTGSLMPRPTLLTHQTRHPRPRQPGHRTRNRRPHCTRPGHRKLYQRLRLYHQRNRLPQQTRRTRARRRRRPRRHLTFCPVCIRLRRATGRHPQATRRERRTVPAHLAAPHSVHHHRRGILVPALDPARAEREAGLRAGAAAERGLWRW